MRLVEIHPSDLVYADEATRRTGVPGQVIRQWARRGRIQKFTGDGRPNGLGHGQRTMYALPEIAALAPSYRPTPQRAPHAACFVAARTGGGWSNLQSPTSDPNA